MNRIDADTTADIYFQMNWSSQGVRHTDAYSGHRVNFWRDLLPKGLYDNLMGRHTGDLIQMPLSAKHIMERVAPTQLQNISRRQFNGVRIATPSLKPRSGRFYPKGVLNGMPGIFKANKEPFRCIQVDNGHIGIAMGHPIAERELDLKVTVGSIESKLEERGGSLVDWGETMTQGVGMQARWKNVPTDFFSDNPFRRQDESPDMEFYQKPRLVWHIDSTAADIVRQIHGRFINQQTRILDLMSSWQSHLPFGVQPKHVIGLGLNETELSRNQSLDHYVVHDLNHTPRLPFDANSFDLVVCSLSIEYLTAPWDLFTDLARVIAPGGYMVVTFSNRWFEPKAIRIWSELHEFERMGLVLEYFRHGNLFVDLHTYSVRGLPRPVDDRYSGKILYSDPVYAVWGRRR